MRKTALIRWEGMAQSEEDQRKYFLSVDLDTGLATYATMRTQYEAAGRILDDRIQKERNVEACANCGKRFGRDMPWYSRNAYKDPITGFITNVFACSMACLIATKGKETQQRSRF